MIKALSLSILFLGLVISSTLSAQVLIPLAGNNQVNCGTNTTLCDHAGCASDYGVNADGYTVLQTTGNTSVSINGNYDLAAGESIIIYDGVGTGGLVITTLTNSGTYNLIGTIGQQITVRFLSDATFQAPGFSFGITYTGSPSITCPPEVITGCDLVGTFDDAVAIDGCVPAPCASEALATVMSNFITNGPAITGAIPNPFNFTDGIVGTNIPDGGSDMYDGGNILNTNLGTAIPYSNGVITPHAAFGAGGQYFTQKINNMFIMVADMNNVTTFEITGNNGADGAGTLNDFTYTVTSGCLDYDVYVKRINSAGDPSINQIFIVPTGTGATHTYSPTTDNSLHTLSAINSATRLYYLLVAGNAGYAYTNAEIQALVLDFLTQTGASASAPSTVSVTQTVGLPSGSTFPIGTNLVTFEATTTLGATATCSFNVIAPDPSLPVITCPADIVTGCDLVGTFSDPIATDLCGAGPCASEALATVMSNFITNGPAITGAIPNPFNFTDGIVGTNIPDGGSDMYDGGNILNTNLGTAIPYSNGVITPHAAFGAGGQYFTQKINNMFIMVADMNNVTTFEITGNNGADGAGTLNDFTYTVTSGCLDYDVYVKRINSAGDPSINQIFIVPTGTGATHTYSPTTDNSLHTLSAINSATRLYYLLVAGNAGYAYTNAEIQALVLDFLTQTGASGAASPPVTVTQIAGLPSGSTFPIGTNLVTFEATTTLGATATCSFNVIAPDPGLPVITCPADIVTGCDLIGTFSDPVATDLCGAGPCASEALATVMSNFITNGPAITGAIPNPFNFTDGIVGTNIPDGGSDMYDGGNILNTNLGTAIPYSNGVITPHAAFGAGGQYFTQKINNMFIMVADMNNVTTFEITGNNGADGAGTLNDFTYTVTSGCLDYDVYVKRINSAGDPSINQIFIVPTGTGATHTYSPTTDNSLHTLSAINSATRLYYLLVAGNAGYAYTNAEIQALVLDFLTQTGASGAASPPVTVTQIAGLPSGSTFPSGTNVVTFEATTTLGATATCSFNVIAPVPGFPVITCPADIVTGCDLIGTFSDPVASDPCGVACASEALATVMSNFITNGPAITGAIPNPFNFTDGIVGTNIPDGGSDMYDGGNILNTNLGTAIPYSNGVITPHAAFGAGGQYFTQKINNMFIMVADMDNVTTFEITGNNGADGAGTLNDFTYTVTSGCLDYDVYVKRINSAGDPSINQIFIVPTGTGATHTYSPTTDNSLHTLSAINSATRLYYLLVAGNAGYAYTNAEIQALVLDFLTQTGASGSTPSPVTVAQIAGLPSGSVFPAGSSVVTFEATTALGATSTCSFNVVTPSSTAPTITPLPGTFCPNTTIALNASGGIAGAGSSINWYTGPNGTGTFLGTGSNINYSGTSTANIYARREDPCGNTADDMITINIKTFVYGLNGAVTNTYCTDDNGWHHFYSGSEILLSIEGDISGAAPGFPQVSIGDNGSFYQETEGPATAPGCATSLDPGEERFEMERNWNVDFGGGALNPPYSVRFYYQTAERTAIETAATAWIATYPACGYTYKYAFPLGFYWFKNSGANYTAPDYDGLQLAGTNGTTANGINYDELVGITSFSGGSGAIILTPISILPVTIGTFTAECGENGANNIVHWSTLSEINSDYFLIEKSTDGIAWTEIGQTDAAGNSSSPQYYSHLDPDPQSEDVVYYRLSQYDQDGTKEVNGVINLKCETTELGFSVFPNPASSNVAIAVEGDVVNSLTYFVVTDMNGRLIKRIEYIENNGRVLNLNIEEFSRGCYMIRMIGDGQMIQVERIIKL